VLRHFFFKEIKMALSNTQKSGLKALGIALIAGLAGVFAESSGLLGEVSKFILSLFSK
jgi:hypothetical protein